MTKRQSVFKSRRAKSAQDSRIEEILKASEGAGDDLQPWGDYYRLRAKEMETLLSLYKMKKVKRILEVGCGNGFVSAILSGYADEVVATDLLRRDTKTHSIGISKAEEFFDRMGIKNCRIVSCSAEKLPFGDRTFDLVFSAYTLEHIPDRDAALREAGRVLKDGAEAVFIVPGFMERLLYPFSYYCELLKKAVTLFFANGKNETKPEPVVEGPGRDDNADRLSPPASIWRRFRNSYPYFPMPDPHGEYPDYFNELIRTFSFNWFGLIDKSGLKIKDSFTMMLFPKSFFSVFSGARSLDLYIKTLWMDKRFGKNILLKHLGQNLCLILGKGRQKAALKKPGNVLVKIFDSAASLVLAGFFLSAIGVILLISKLTKEKPRRIKEIVQLYITIADFRKSVISTHRDDVLLHGFVDKNFIYYFDFESKRDERVKLDEDTYLNSASVHPDNLLTRAGLIRTMAFFVELKTFLMMYRTVLKEGVNVIRAQDPHLLGFNAYLLSRLLKVPFMVQVCSNYELKDRQAKKLAFRPFMFQAIERRFERAIMRSADMVVTDREHYRSFGLIPKDIPAERYGNMGFFVNEAHYAPPESRKNLRDDLGIPADKAIFLYVGRLCEVKYPLDLIRMFALCLRKRDDIVLLIAGDGVLMEDMKRMSEENNIKDNVVFLQSLQQHELRDLYHTADVVCFTSAGFTMIEAALAEKCIVAYDFEWHNEFIGDNERGILVPFGDYDKFAQEALRALEDAGLRRRLGVSARAYALKNYMREGSIEKEIMFYRNVFKKRGYVIEKTL